MLTGKSEILKEVNRQFNDITGIQSIVLHPETTAYDVPEWDSLTHIQLVVNLEKYFKIKFTSAEVQNWKNAGEIVTSILVRVK